MISLRKVLATRPITASAPCRIDSGGTWDIKAMALPLEKIRPVTVNIALNLRTSATLAAYEDGYVRVVSEGFPQGESYPADNLPLDSPFALFFAAAAYFGFHGLEIRIVSQSPVKSALGGSSTALVALIKALAKASLLSGGKNLSRRQILHLAYHLEDAVSGGSCGLQDQAAALYGGVHLWEWSYSRPNSPLSRTVLLDRHGQKELSSHLLVAYSGKSHFSLRINHGWIADFLSGSTRAGWIEVNRIVWDLAKALSRLQWKAVARLLQEEMAVRRKITPEALIPITAKLLDQALEAGCGARFCGAGAGGSVWALGDQQAINCLRSNWKKTLPSTENARLLDCAVDSVGVR